MNIIRERVLNSITPYVDFSEHKDLIAFCVSAECFYDFKDDDNKITADFNEVIVIVEKDWLFNYMNINDPLHYLCNEYTSDDAITWFDEAIMHNKVVMVSFN